MKTVTFIGTVTNAAGCAVSLILYRGDNVIWIHHYFDSFNFSFQLDNNNYDITVNGVTQGSFDFDIQGSATNITPAVPHNYPQNIAGSYNFDVK